MKHLEAKTLVSTVTADAGGQGDDAAMTISTGSVDLDGDRLLPEGVILDGFLKNPVLLWAHDSSSLPIGTVTRVEINAGQGLRAAWRWLVGDEFAARVKNAWDQGCLRAASVGFMPLEREPNRTGGYDFSQWRLLELSLVPVPANPEAVRHLKRLGLLSPPATDDVGEMVRAGMARLLGHGGETHPSPAVRDFEIRRAVAEGIRRALRGNEYVFFDAAAVSARVAERVVSAFTKKGGSR